MTDRKELAELSPQNSVRAVKFTELGARNRTFLNHILSQKHNLERASRPSAIGFIY